MSLKVKKNNARAYAERSVVGCLLIDPQKASEIKMVSTRFFSDKNHKEIIEILIDMMAGDYSLNTKTLLNRISEKGSNGLSDYAIALFKDTPSAVNIKTYANLMTRPLIV